MGASVVATGPCIDLPWTENQLDMCLSGGWPVTSGPCIEPQDLPWTVNQLDRVTSSCFAITLPYLREHPMFNPQK